MKIAIVTLTTTARRTGVAEYIINLLNGLQKIDQENEYVIFTSRDNRYMFNLVRPNFKEINLPLTHASYQRPFFYFWLTFILPLWARRNKVDLVHLPNTLFVTGFFKTVTTIHDVVELKVAKYSRLRTFFRWLMVKSAIRNSSTVITVSESSKRDLTEMGAKRIKAIHLGFNNPYASFSSSAGDEHVLNKYHLADRPFLLSIGTLLKHKNIPVLVDAFKLALEKHANLQLVIVGAPDNDYENVLQVIAHHQIEDKVQLLNFLGQDEKLILLRNAHIFCFISSYEGFGIPILEAQAAGTPVIANNISSLPEIGGLGVYLVEPANLRDETSQAIETLLKNEPLRNSYVEKGYENIKRFSWDRFAQQTLDIYSESIEA